MAQHIIYGLFDPNTQELRYIGYTSNQTKRYCDHHRKARLASKSHKNSWIKSLVSKSQKAEMYILEEYQTAEELPQAEIELIEYYRSIGCDLTNGTNGGEGNNGRKHSDETKMKMSIAHKGKKISDEHKNNLSIVAKSQKRKPPSRKGAKMSEESKQKISENKKGVKWHH